MLQIGFQNNGAETKLFFIKLGIFGWIGVPYLLFLFFYIYSPFYKKKHFYVLIAITSIIPIIGITGLFFNTVHGGFIYKHVGIHEEVKNIGFDMLMYFLYTITIAGVILVGVKVFHRGNKLNIKNKIAMLIGIFIPVMVNVIKNIVLPGLNIIFEYDPTVISMSVAVLFFMYGIFGLKLLNILPRAMSDLFEQMNEGVIVLADDYLILKTNKFVKKIFDGEGFENMPLQEMLGEMQAGEIDESCIKKIKNYFRNNEKFLENLKASYTKPDGERFIFYISISWITNKRNKKLGYLMIIHEYTEIAMLQEELNAQSLKLKETFEKLNPGVSDIITKGQMHLGEICASNYFCDVVGYTILNMLLGDKLISRIMNEFLSKSHIITTKYHGYRDKINGDQVITIFGIKKDECQASQIHPFDAVFSALKIKELAVSISAKFPELIKSEKATVEKNFAEYIENTKADLSLENLSFSLRHGISTSKINPEQEINRLSMTMMGDESGFDYTCQGGAVILAARLERQSKSSSILISEETYSRINNIFHAEKLPALYLKNLGYYPYYNLIGLKTLTDEYFPQTIIKIASPWKNKIIDLRKKIIIGAIYFYEISKIVDEVTIDLEYMEHLKGTMNVGTFRAFWALSFAHILGIPKDNLIFTALLDPIRYRDFPSMNIKVKYNIEKQLPKSIDYNQIRLILKNSYKKDRSSCPEEIKKEIEIIRFSRLLDNLTFDHTYLRESNTSICSIDSAVKKILDKEDWLPGIRETIKKLI